MKQDVGGGVDDVAFDNLSERGQYRAFQRAYGKENQAMLGLILLTVAWSYAAHVYGHGTVFTWFTRYIVMGILVVLLYHVLQYAHSGFERTMRVWNGVAERKARDAKEAKLKEKAKERRKRAKDNEKTAAEIAEDKEAE